MHYQTTDVYRFLIFLHKYLLGDLKLFHQLAKDAEKKEREIASMSANKGCLSFFIVEPPSSTSITTTKYPYSFEFMFGDPIISRSTIPNTATFFSTIDILGFLTRTGNDYGSTTKNITEFFSYPTTTIDLTELAVLTNIYRHGMTHSYFPKLNVEVSYHSSNPIGHLFFKRTTGGLVLNVNQLEKLVVARLNEVINDASLYPNMDSQLSIMTADYLSRTSALISTLLAKL